MQQKAALHRHEGNKCESRIIPSEQVVPALVRMAIGSAQDAREARIGRPERFLCNVSLPDRRVPGALIYDVRALRVGIEPQRMESPPAIPSV
jgi:hypothetical protein